MADSELKFVITAEAAQALARLRETQERMRGLAGEARATATATGGLSQTLGGAGTALSGVARGALAAGAAVLTWRAAAAAVGATIGAIAEAERQQLLLEQTVRATGGAAGRTAADIEALVQAHARAGAAGVDAARAAATQLLTFRSIAGEAFDRTLAAAVDLAAVGFGSVESAAVSLGKAMEDPARGLTALTRVGVTFTAEQKRVIQGLVDTGRTAEAQARILEAVEGQVGGAGAAQGAGLAGAFRTLGHELGEFGEVVGGEIARLIGLEDRLRATAGAVAGFRAAVAGDLPGETADDIAARIEALRAERAALQATLAEALEAAASPAVATAAAARLEAASRAVEELERQLGGLSREEARHGGADPAADRSRATAMQRAEAELAAAVAARAAAARELRAAELAAAGEGVAATAGVQARVNALSAAIGALAEQWLALRNAEVQAGRTAAESAAASAAAQAAILRGRADGVISGLRDEAEAARMTRIEQEALTAARAAGIDPATDVEGWAQVLAAVREVAAARAEADGQARLADWQARADIARIEAEFGRDSAEATRARAAAERDALAAGLEARGVAEELAAAILAAWDAAQRFATTDMAGPIARARAEARAMADEIGRAIAATRALQAQSAGELADATLRWEMRDDPVGLAGELAFRRMVETQGVRREGAEGAELAQLDAEAEAERRLAEERARVLQRSPAASAASGGAGGRAGAGGGLAALQDEAAGLLSELDLKVAQIHARVETGLMSVAEGQDAVAAAKARTAGELADLIPRFEVLGDAGVKAAERIRDAARETAATVGGEMGDAIAAAADRIDKAGENAFVSWVKNGGDMTKMLVDTIITEFARLFYAQHFSGLIGDLFDGIFGGLFAARGAAVAGGRVLAYAAGGVPAALPALSAARNSVVDRPTLFALAGGRAGLMGEAGAEAIMPLVAAAGGGLGVRATGPGGEMVLPLQRAAGGALGVALPFALGGVPGRMVAAMGPGPRPAVAPAAAAMPAPAVNVELRVTNNAAAGNERVRYEERAEGDTRVFEVIIDAVRNSLGEDAARGRGGWLRGLEQAYGLSRRGR